MNSINITGNLTRDPETTQTPSGTTVCKFGVAVKRNFGDEVDFFNVQAWRQQAENCGKYLRKGNKVAITGEIQMRVVENENGYKTTYWDLIAQHVTFLTTKAENEAQTDLQEPTLPPLTPVEDEGKLPF